MDEETKVIESAEKAENAEKNAEKKYSEEEMNGIVTRKSEKAVQKALKELGITDREKAKEVLKNAEKSGGQPTVQKNEGSTDELQKKLEERCRVLKNEAVDARIENAVLSAGVNSEKVKYAVHSFFLPSQKRLVKHREQRAVFKGFAGFIRRSVELIWNVCHCNVCVARKSCRRAGYFCFHILFDKLCRRNRHIKIICVSHC